MSERLGLVTVLFNCPEVIPGFFESLAKQQEVDYTLWVIDNSTDSRSVDAARAECEFRKLTNVIFITNDRNVGVARGNNQGIIAALNSGTDYVILLNNDIEFGDSLLLRKMLDVAINNHEQVIIPKMLYFDSRRVWCAGGFFRRWAGTTRHIGDGDLDGPAYDVAGYTEYAPTCFMLVSRAVFERVGLMDERYFVYYDDSDFVWRLNNSGFQIRYEPALEVLHKVSSSTGGALSAFAVFYYTRNRFLFISNNYSWAMRCVAVPVFILTLLSQWVRYDHGLRVALWNGVKAGLPFLSKGKFENIAKA